MTDEEFNRTYGAAIKAIEARRKRSYHSQAMLAALRQIADGHENPRELAAGIVKAFDEDETP